MALSTQRPEAPAGMNAAGIAGRVVCLGAVSAVFVAQVLTWLVHSMAEKPDTAALLAALGRRSGDLVLVSLDRPARSERGRVIHLVPLPEAWLPSAADPRPRSRLRLFVDEQPTPLQARPRRPRDDWDPASPRTYAYVDAVRQQLVLWCPSLEPCRTVAVVRRTASATVRLAWSRLARLPLRGLAALLVLAVWFSLGRALWRGTPDVYSVCGSILFVGASVVWLQDLHRYGRPSALLVGVALLALAVPLLVRALVEGGAGHLFSDVLFVHDPRGQPRPWWWPALGSLSIAGLSAAVFAGSSGLRPPSAMPEPSELHRNQSLEIAVNRASCGTSSRLSPAHSLASSLEASPSLLLVPLRELARQAAGSLDRYCETVVEPHINHENSLMLTMDAFLRLAPGLSLTGLGWCLQALRIVALLLFALALLRCGASWLSAGLALWASILVLEGLGVRFYSVYPFLPPLLVVTIATFACLLQRGAGAAIPSHLVSAAVIGWLIGFATNMRTSHTPVYAVLLVAYFAAAWHGRLREGLPWPPRERAAWLAAGALGAGLGWALFSAGLIQPLTRESSVGRAYSYHVVMHSVVISLALPESPLSRREGMGRGDDLVGLALARRIDPAVEFLRDGYEWALFRYYCQLWARHPREMLDLYGAKFKIAGASMISSLLEASNPSPGQRLTRALLWPLTSAGSGAVLLLVYAGALLAAGMTHLRTGHPLAFIVAALAAAAALLQLESSLIDPHFTVSHNSSLLLCVLLLGIAGWQLGLEAVRVALRAFKRRRTPIPDVRVPR
jgi:hypothetical protein